MKQHRLKAPRSAIVVTWITFFALYFPLFVLILFSFLTQELTWTLEWYRKIFSNETILSSFQASLTVGFWSTLGATFLGTSSALALYHGRISRSPMNKSNLQQNWTGKSFIEALAYVPLVMPEIVLGLSLLVWFVATKLALGLLSITIAHVTFSLSYVVITVKARLHGFDRSLEEAARDLGANPWQVFWRITFPLIWPGIFSGALMAFTLSFDDFLIAFFTAGVGSDTLPIKIYSMIKFGISPEVNALSTLMILATFVLVGFLFKPFRLTS